MPLDDAERGRLVEKVLRVVLGLSIDDAVEVLCRAYVAIARVTGRTKEDVVRSVEALLEREASH